MKIFSYNSKHKLIIGLLIIGYAAYHFNGKRTTANYDDSGKILQSGDFNNGKNHGLWIWFYPNGKRKMEGNFNMGKREGAWLTFNVNGRIISESFYINDQLNGVFSIWDYNGNLVKKTNYLNDKPIIK